MMQGLIELMTENAWPLVAGAGLAALGYFGRRFVEGTHRDQKLQRSLQMLEIMDKMKAHGLETAEPETLEEMIFNRSPRLRQIEDDIRTELAPQSEPVIITQAEMTADAWALEEKADVALNGVLQQYRSELNTVERERFDAAQEAWFQYIQLQAEVLASLVEGGSMEPMVRAGELERLKVARAAEITDLIALNNQ